MVGFDNRLAGALLDIVTHAAKLFLDRHGHLPPFGVVMGPDEHTIDMVQALEGEAELMPQGEAAWRKADSLLTAKLQQRARDPSILATAQVTPLETTQGMMLGVQLTFASGFAPMLIPYGKVRAGWELGKPIGRDKLIFEPQQLDFQPPLTAEAQKYLADACDELDMLQGMLNRRWHLDAPHKVQFDRNRSCLVFSFTQRSVEAQAEVLGTYRPRDQSWNWAWDQEGLAPFAPGGAAVRALGDRFEVDYLRVPAYRVPDASFLGLLAAVGVKATKAIGHYIAASATDQDPLEIVYLVKSVRAKAPE